MSRSRSTTSQGRRLVALVDGPQQPGRYVVDWDGRDAGGRSLPSGVYFYELRAGAEEQVRRMLLVK